MAPAFSEFIHSGVKISPLHLPLAARQMDKPGFAGLVLFYFARKSRLSNTFSNAFSDTQTDTPAYSRKLCTGVVFVMPFCTAMRFCSPAEAAGQPPYCSSTPEKRQSVPDTTRPTQGRTIPSKTSKVPAARPRRKPVGEHTFERFVSGRLRFNNLLDLQHTQAARRIGQQIPVLQDFLKCDVGIFGLQRRNNLGKRLRRHKRPVSGVFLGIRRRAVSSDVPRHRNAEKGLRVFGIRQENLCIVRPNTAAGRV